MSYITQLVSMYKISNKYLSKWSSINPQNTSTQDIYVCIYCIYMCIYIYIHIYLFIYLFIYLPTASS